jgi:hypothetical protein
LRLSTLQIVGSDKCAAVFFKQKKSASFYERSYFGALKGHDILRMFHISSVRTNCILRSHISACLHPSESQKHFSQNIALAALSLHTVAINFAHLRALHDSCHAAKCNEAGCQV